jgi:hypothetical protein
VIRPSLTCECGRRMWLPYRKSPAGLSEPEWTPKEFLTREIGCPECGRAFTYGVRDVRWVEGAEIDPITGAHEVSCWHVETVCNEQRCELPIQFHWLTGGNSGPEEIRFRTLRLFEREFFKNLLCGRGHQPGTRVPTVRRVGYTTEPQLPNR